MADKPLSFGNFQLVSEAAGARQLDPEEPFRILICGDFSGRTNRVPAVTATKPATLRPILIDRDNFEQVLQQLDVLLDCVLTDSDGHAVSVKVRELDDFHPDRLFAAIPLFDSLSSTRRRLLNTATFSKAAAEVQSWAKLSTGKNETSPTIDRPAADIPADLLGDILSSAEQTAQQRGTPDEWQSLIHSIVAPYSIPGADPRRDEFVRLVDQAIGKTMQVILRHPDFQALEANWRGLYRLVRGLDTGSRLQLYIVDVSLPELAAGLAGDDLSASPLYRLLETPVRGATEPCPYALSIGAYYFGNRTTDVEWLGRIAQIAAATRTRWLSAAASDLAGSFIAPESSANKNRAEPPNEPWEALRGLAAASFVGVTWPRFLSCMPYGRQTSPTEAFHFEELDDQTRHDDLPWCNGVYLAALAAGQAFSADGWDLDLAHMVEFSGMPIFTWKRNGDSELQTPGEMLLDDVTTQRLMAQGVTPLLSIRNDDRLRLGMLRAVNGQPLAGRWSS